MSRSVSVVALAVVLFGAVAANAASWNVTNWNFATIACDVSFADAKTGIAPISDNGQGSTVAYTTDGGATWNSAPTPETLMYLGGAAQGTAAVAAAMLSLQYNSALDGYNFSTSILSPLMISQNVEAAFGSSFFATGQTADGYNGVATSTDYGATWTVVNVTALQASARYGAFPSPTTWYLSAGDFPNNNSANSESELVSRQLTNRIRVGIRSSGERFFKMSPSSPAIAPSGWDAQIVKTTDGGKTWKSLFYNANNYYFNQIDCASETHCGVVAEADTSAEPGIRIFMTFDGVNWEQTFYNPDPTESLLALKFVNDNEVWAAGGQISDTLTGKFYQSLDGGKTWATFTVDGVYGNSLAFPTPTTGFATAFNFMDTSSLMTYS